MAQSNHERVGRALDTLNKGLKPFVEREMTAKYGVRWQYEAVTVRKQRKLRQLAEVFMAANGLSPEAIRFDVASVHTGPGVRTSVELFEDAF